MTAELTNALRALADPSRRAQLQRLSYGPATSGQLAELLTMSRPAGSQHLGVLIDAGLITSMQSGRQRWHEIRPQNLYLTENWLGGLLRQWESAPTLRLPDRESPQATVSRRP